MSKIGFFCAPDTNETLINSFLNAKNMHHSGICSDLSSKASEQVNSTNPFLLISNSDILIFDVSQPEWYNLAIESIQQSKHIILLNPYFIRHEQIKYLQMLSNEAEIMIQPHINPKAIALSKVFKNTSYIKVEINTGKNFWENHEYYKHYTTICDIVASLMHGKIKRCYSYSSRYANKEMSINGTHISFINGNSAHIEINTNNKDGINFQIKVCDEEKTGSLEWSNDAIDLIYYKSGNTITEKIEYKAESFLNEAINGTLTGTHAYKIADFMSALRIFEELKKNAS